MNTPFNSSAKNYDFGFLRVFITSIIITAVTRDILEFITERDWQLAGNCLHHLQSDSVIISTIVNHSYRVRKDHKFKFRRIYK